MNPIIHYRTHCVCTALHLYTVASVNILQGASLIIRLASRFVYINSYCSAVFLCHRVHACRAWAGCGLRSL